MTRATLIKAELDSVRSDLAEVFPHLKDDLLPWAPTEGMRTIQGQIVEIISTELSMTDAIQGLPKVDFSEREAPFWEIKTLEGLLKALAETRASTLALLESMSDEQLGQALDLGKGWADYLCLDPVPTEEAFRFIARHESYHVGQLVSYLWARGNDPYSWE
ncbi:MAG: DinB family protein [Fimbriimonadaceae bacterium]|jgi:uncharacterized damage-inducible protein DinB|nr:DinB family protein [Fimbriimonadaceae bacterium]